MAFRVHFTRDDLLRVSLAESIDPLIETMVSLQLLQQPRPGAVFGPWQRWARRRVPRSVHLLRSLVQPGMFCPDFLTPLNTTDLDAGLDALLHTPKSFLRADLEAFTRFTGRPVPGWAVELADGSPRALQTVSGAMRDWHRAAIAPMRQHMHTHAEAARSSAARTLLAEGLDAMLSRLHPTIRWTPPVLELARPELNEDLHLEGRGLHLIPSLFCRAPGITLHAELPVLAFPVSHDTGWTPEASFEPESQGGTLGALLGPTRAALLQAITAGHGITTSALARRIGISSATVSHHTTVLRDAGLITTHRTGTSAHHLSTPLGSRLLNGTPACDQQSLSTVEARRRKQTERQP